MFALWHLKREASLLEHWGAPAAASGRDKQGLPKHKDAPAAAEEEGALPSLAQIHLTSPTDMAGTHRSTQLEKSKLAREHIYSMICPCTRWQW